MQEYFAFPEKFFFFELNDLDSPLKAMPGGRAEIIFLIAPFEAEQRQQRLGVGVTAKSILLGCSPIINLFPQTAEPIMLTQQAVGVSRGSGCPAEDGHGDFLHR